MKNSTLKTRRQMNSKEQFFFYRGKINKNKKKMLKHKQNNLLQSGLTTF